MPRATPSARRAAGLLAVLVLLAASALVAGCGGGGSDDALSLVNQAFKHPVPSANVTVEATAGLNGGVAQLGGPIQLKLAGPYVSHGNKQIPSFNWNLSFVGAGRSFTGGLTSTGQDAYLTVGSTAYDLGAQRIAQTNQQLAAKQGNGRSLSSFGIDPRSWVTNAQIVGSAQAGGVDTTHVRAGLDVGKLLNDLNKTVSSAGGSVGSPARQLTPQQIASIKSAIKNPTFDIYIAKSDKTVRRLAVALGFNVPSSDQSRFGGLQGGTINLSVELADIGKQFTITAPANPQPLSQLLQQVRRPGQTPAIP
jgi:hypothetical protein